jgi:hypothetical protein
VLRRARPSMPPLLTAGPPSPHLRPRSLPSTPNPRPDSTRTHSLTRCIVSMCMSLCVSRGHRVRDAHDCCGGMPLARFPTAGSLGAWCGLMLIEHSSGQRTWRDRITHAGHAHLRHQHLQSAPAYKVHPALAPPCVRPTRVPSQRRRTSLGWPLPSKRTAPPFRPEDVQPKERCQGRSFSLRPGRSTLSPGTLSPSTSLCAGALVRSMQRAAFERKEKRLTGRSAGQGSGSSRALPPSTLSRPSTHEVVNPGLAAVDRREEVRAKGKTVRIECCPWSLVPLLTF